MTASSSRRSLLVVSLLVAGVLSCRRGPDARIEPDVRARMARAVAYMDSLLAVSHTTSEPGDITEQGAIALGYLERLRLGLGSPFRLIDYALHDPRLSASNRRQVGWSLLSHTLDGSAYALEPQALALLAMSRPEARAAVADAHVALIDATVAAASDPRSAELSLRLAYTLAVAERSVWPRAISVAMQASALARDRELARRDARALLDTTRVHGVDPLSAIPIWRWSRRFAVERPVMEPLSDRLEADAARDVPRLVDSMRVIRDRSLTSSKDQSLTSSAAPALARALALPAIGLAAARRLADLGSVRGAPPQAPIVVAVQTYQSRLVASSPNGRADVAARARFASRVRNEEALAAEHALVASDTTDPAAVLVTLSAAVALRAYAQEDVWFPGFEAPSVGELKRQFGIASIGFDEDAPVAWRPYYLRMVAAALTDMQRVLPDLSVRGIGLHFGASVMRDTALALHDPVTRTVYLPFATAAGSIAHEIAHDVDWQVARARYDRRAGYSTDFAVREQRGRLAANLSGLTTARLVPPIPENGFRPPSSQRPAEVFARSVDWFVAASLAGEGRMNGYLSGMQDARVAAGSVGTTSAITGDAGETLLDVIEDMTTVAEPAREWFLDHYGRGRPHELVDIVRRVLAVPLPDRGWGTGASGARGGPFAMSTPLIDDPSLLARAEPCPPRDKQDAARAARERELETLSAEARARGALREQRRANRIWNRAWPERALDGAPWRPEFGEEFVRTTRDAILRRLDQSGTGSPMAAYLLRGADRAASCARD